jgi:hypothetical protein
MAIMIDLNVDEWTQREYLSAKHELESQGLSVVLVDTILNPIAGAETITYNPPLLREYQEGSVFVFYCDSGKSSYERLKEFRTKFPNHICISLRGGRGYWRKNLRV